MFLCFMLCVALVLLKRISLEDESNTHTLSAREGGAGGGGAYWRPRQRGERRSSLGIGAAGCRLAVGVCEAGRVGVRLLTGSCGNAAGMLVDAYFLL